MALIFLQEADPSLRLLRLVLERQRAFLVGGEVAEDVRYAAHILGVLHGELSLRLKFLNGHAHASLYLATLDTLKLYKRAF